MAEAVGVVGAPCVAAVVTQPVVALVVVEIVAIVDAVKGWIVVDVVSARPISPVFLLMLVSPFLDTQRREVLKQLKRSHWYLVAIMDTPEPGEAPSLRFVHSNIRVLVVRGHFGEIMDFSNVDDDTVFDSPLPPLGRRCVSVTCTEEEESKAPVVNISHIILGIRLGSAVQAHNSMPRVSVGCSRFVSTHWSEQVRPTILSTSSSSHACLGTPLRTMRTL